METCLPAMPWPGVPNAAANTMAFLTMTSQIGAKTSRNAIPAMEYVETENRMTISATPIPPAPTRVSFRARTWSSWAPDTIMPSPKSVSPSKWMNLLPMKTVARTTTAAKRSDPKP